jgi:hypothetical protein
VDGLHVQGVAKHELDPFPAAEVRQPVPREHALDRDHEVVAVRRDGLEERLGTAPHVLVEEDLALPIEDAQVHGLRMQIDPAVVLMAFVVESHGSLLKRLAVSCTNQPTPSGVGAGGGLDEDQGLAADNRQLGVPESGSILASGQPWHGADGQRCLLQLKPDPLCRTTRAEL